jgi:UDP-N-acetylglucosamine 2-epimerase (non-hydrolysing)
MILFSYGTRPEYIKIKPLLDIFDKNHIKYKTLFTGQHKDILVNNKFDYKIDIENITNERLDNIIISILSYFDNIKNIDYVLIQGDTTSALSVALTAFNRKIKIIHLESGLRTYDNDNPYPEEQNRRIISQIANIHLCPTTQNLENLLIEKCLGSKFVVGNTVIDNLLKYKDKCEYNNEILITLHRRENHNIIDKWFNTIEELSIKYPQYDFIFPIHPNPNIQKYKYLLKNVKVIEPLSHEDFVFKLIKSRMVITDSGGIQEECSFFNKKCLICRKVTERTESINYSTFLVETPDQLVYMFDKHINNYKIQYECPYGDGYSSEKIFKIISEL